MNKLRLLFLATIAVFTLGALIAFSAAPAYAVDCPDPSPTDPQCTAETSTKPEEPSDIFTVITWTSSFQVPNYSVGETINMTVSWTVDEGAAVYYQGQDPDKPVQGFVLKSYTPKKSKDAGKPKKEPVDGTPITVTLVDDSNDDDNPADGVNEGAVHVTFNFTDLHRDETRLCEIGNVHFKLYLWIDKDGNGTPESVAGYGVNVHVEDPDDPATACLPDDDGGSGGGGK